MLKYVWKIKKLSLAVFLLEIISVLYISVLFLSLNGSILGNLRITIFFFRNQSYKVEWLRTYQFLDKTNCLGYCYTVRVRNKVVIMVIVLENEKLFYFQI